MNLPAESQNPFTVGLLSKCPPVPNVVGRWWHVFSEVSGIDPPLVVWPGTFYWIVKKGKTVSLVITRDNEAYNRPFVIGRGIDAARVCQSGIPEKDVSGLAREFHWRDISQNFVTGLGKCFCIVGTYGAIGSFAVWVQNMVGAGPDGKTATVWRYFIYENHCRQLGRGLVCVGPQSPFFAGRFWKYSVDPANTLRRL
ncbi:MAG: hypothetical protein ACI8V2_002245, partial [Candidatus Latescibacterota bacterium]